MLSKNVPNLLKGREQSERINRTIQRKLQVYGQLVQRLGLETELRGHEGCVNCLQWNTSGSVLASGSDDLHVILWDPFKRKIRHKISTGHSANIFSVKFMPNTGDEVLVTGAGDFHVCVHSVPQHDTIQTFKCHTMRVKRLASSPDAPHLIWSASEDGTIRQFDLRESHICHANENCKNILIDLTLHVGSCEIKCIEVNPCQSELLAVGCSDPYVRMYDRRMLRKHCLTSDSGVSHCCIETCPSSIATLPNGCARYFTPGHLPCTTRRGKRRSVVSTYLTFSPNGQELLVNLGGEQLYLFDIRRQRPPLTYTPDSFSSDNSCSISKNGFVHHKSSVGAEEEMVGGNATLSKTKLSGTNGFTKTNDQTNKTSEKTGGLAGKSTELSGKALELKFRANTEYENKNYWGAINLYNQALILSPDSAVLYANRAAAFLKRGWYGDVYSALRDCEHALTLDLASSKAAYRQARCLFELEWFPEAEACLKRFISRFPDECNSKLVKCLERDIKAALFSQTEDGNGKSSNRDRSRRHETYSGTLLGSLKRINDSERELRTTSNDYKSRFCGHCNTTTDIKEANFFGANGEYIVAGSDDGSFFVWEKSTANLLRILKGDESIVNCLQPHPSGCILATSGIDPVVRLWSPQAEHSDESGDERRVPDNEFAQVAKDNQRRMKTDPFEVMMMNLGYTVTRERTDGDDSDGEYGSVTSPNCHAS
ncbi:WD and tetratricopeptide repeats protein 1-like [Dendronephthya gigantea]|uniref:WD and tetratricopeptide repeats protein 1-like n=1 Tax=Dendronephthya gigantea TaxID=151771 RepID=UPI00106AFE69|nr:WD and tetratricopeptide repeats protein 1-like [Dendronephthya gigantea]